MLTYTAFEDQRLLSTGPLDKVIIDVTKKFKSNPSLNILIFSDTTGKQMDFDLSGSEKEILGRLKIFISSDSQIDSQVSQGPGRPKLGVVPREISLHPRHWEWLSTQTGGSSAMIRVLVEEAMKNVPHKKDKVKQSQESTYKFLTAIAGDLPNFEEAIRFLYRRDKKKFKELISDWPKDLVLHSMNLASDAFSSDAK